MGSTADTRGSASDRSRSARPISCRPPLGKRRVLVTASGDLRRLRRAQAEIAAQDVTRVLARAGSQIVVAYAARSGDPCEAAGANRDTGIGAARGIGAGAEYVPGPV